MPLREQEFLDAAVSQGLIEDDQLIEIRRLANAQGISSMEAITIAHRIPLKALYHAVAAERNIRFVDLGIFGLMYTYTDLLKILKQSRRGMPECSLFPRKSKKS